MDDITVVVATYGPEQWIELARERALPSAKLQTDRVIHAHGRTLAAARNAGLGDVRTEFVIHLDADDELEPGYIEAMGRGSADLRGPAVRYVTPHGRERAPHVPRVPGHDHDLCLGSCLPDGNWLVIGTAVRTELLRRVGGWKDEELYEDWSAWLRCHCAGGSVEAVPEAVYRAHVRPCSRNRYAGKNTRLLWHRRIHRACFPEQYAEAA